jgi:hypothetical protein
VAQVAAARRAQIDPAVRLAHATTAAPAPRSAAERDGRPATEGGMQAAPITATGADISARDNADLAQATAAIAAAFAGLRDRGLIDDAEYLRIVYRFAGEQADVAGLLARAKVEDREE